VVLGGGFLFEAFSFFSPLSWSSRSPAFFFSLEMPLRPPFFFLPFFFSAAPGVSSGIEEFERFSGPKSS